MSNRNSSSARRAYLTGCVVAVLALVAMLNVAPGVSLLGTRMLSVHLVLELFAIVIASLVVMVSWHTFGESAERSAPVLVSGFLIVAVCDLLHALTYSGMPRLLSDSNTPSAIFFWLAGRSMEVATLGAVAVGFVPRVSRNTALAFGVAVAAALAWIGSFHVDALPATFIEGVGVTPFKARYEYMLCGLNLLVAWMLATRTARAKVPQASLLAMSSFTMGIGELAFTTYVTPSDFQNIFGHVYKVAAYSLLYRATFIGSIRAPFRALSASEALLRESEQRMRTLGNNLPQSVIFQLVMEPDGSRRFVHISEALERIVGLKVSEVQNSPMLLFQRIHRDDLPALVDAERRSVERMQPYDVRIRVLGLSGQWIRMNIVAAPRRMADGRVVWDGIQTDVTEREQADEARRRLEVRVFEAQKMDSIGTLASGIAHDFNNVLGAILGNAALASEDIAKGATQEAQDSLDQVRTAGLRARDLVRHILTFSRGQAPQRSVQPLRPIIEEGLGLLRATLPARVSITTRFTDDPILAMVDATQIEQIVLNLCTNASQAMGEAGGNIVVGLDAVDVSDELASRITLPSERCAHLWFEDNGSGMDEATRARAFEPFFTTKSVGVGTGLGLSVVHGIVRACQGSIALKSTPGVGTRFDIHLPLSTSAAAAASVVTVAAKAANGQGRRVLYLDDDPVMTLMVERLLARDGHEVTVFNHPQQALAEMASNPDAYDVLVTDFNMPSQTGLDVIRAAESICPRLPVVLTSGWVSEELRARADELGVGQVLEKQNTLEDLPAAIARACAPTEGHPAAGT